MTIDRFLVSGLFSIPFAAWALPLFAPWGLALPLVVVSFATTLAARNGNLFPTLLSSAAFLVAVVTGLLPVYLGSAIMAIATALSFGSRHIPIAAAGMALHTSTAATLEASLASLLAGLTLEAASPAIIGSITLAAVTWHRPIVAFVSIPICLAMALAAETYGILPHLALTLAAIPLIVAVMVTGISQAPSSALVALVICIFPLITWTATPPRSINDLYVVLPQASDAYESQFFDNYKEALKIAEIEATVTANPSSIPSGAMVLLPWMTVPLSGEGVEHFGALARERGWTVVVTGEHDGYGDVDSRLEQMARRPLLVRNLTVPPRNANFSGPLRSASLVPWRHDSVLNRGASVVPPGISGRILLSGDGWWTEPYLEEWLWTGDYVWRNEDRGGRVPLAGAYMDGEARWIVIGDGSFLLNRHLVTDARPTRFLLSLATLRPSFLADAFAFFVAALALASLLPRRFRFVGYIKPSLAGLIVVTCLFSLMTTPKLSGIQKKLLRGQSGFDQRSFSISLAEEPRLAIGNWTLRREEDPLSGELIWNTGNELLFAHVRKMASFRSVRLSGCWRLGSLQVQGGPYLMDAQACQVEGDAEVLVGSQEAAAVLAFGKGQQRKILVLDTAFLSAGAPIANREWLLEAMSTGEDLYDPMHQYQLK